MTQLRIRNAAELIAALSDPTPAMRLAVLRMVAKHPQQALAYGRHDELDVVDVLLAQAAGRDRRGIWEVVVATLAVFRDPRVVEFFKGLLANARRAETLFAAAKRLGQEPIDPLRDFLRPLLMQNESDARARATARLMVWATELDTAAELRAALLAGRRRVSLPPCTADTASFWLAELNGLFVELARPALEGQGAPAFHVLAAHWDELAEGDRVWLVGWGGADVVRPLVEKALASGSTKLMLAALARVPALGARGAGLAPTVAALATNDDPRVRLAALRAGASGLDFRALLASEQSPALRRTYLASLARQEGRDALPDLVAALRDPHWSVRAAAADAMQALGDEIAPIIEPLAHDADPRIRTAAVQVLIRLGRETWLEEELLA